jgi:hypothetical protein
VTKTKKGFDAVAMMRSIRDKLSTDIEGMTLEQELAWLSSLIVSDPFLKRLRDSAGQPATDSNGSRVAASRS